MSFWARFEGGQRSPFKGAVLALAGRAWEEQFNLRPEGLWRSYWALGACLPLLLVCAKVGALQNSGAGLITAPALCVVLCLALLVFPVFAYFLCQMLGRMELFRPWVIVRNWAGVMVFAGMALVFALSVTPALTYYIAAQIGLLLYVGLLLIDIRVIQIIGDMGWVGAIFTGCGIAVGTLVVLLAGFATAAGA